MYAGVTRYHFLPERMNDAKRVFHDEGLGPKQQLDGYLGCLFLGDPETGSALAVDFWLEEECARRFQGNGGLGRLVAALQPFFSTAADRPVGYEVLLADRVGWLREEELGGGEVPIG
ncbi:hypothetical protein [Vulgatibacter sp.]|uniref:hypothetical protein n=1 Tax=Vulgatibacter sp. TaxID=1971226 RepID=UPI0035640231